MARKLQQLENSPFKCPHQSKYHENLPIEITSLIEKMLAF